MQQHSQETAGPGEGAERVARLRRSMVRRKLDALLVPRADAHQGEYVAPGAARLRWLTGFSGSAGLAVVFADKAAMLVDGRYTTQAANQTDKATFEVVQSPPVVLGDWLKDRLAAGARVGFDPWLHTASQVERLTATLKAAGIKMKPTEENLVDAIWGAERPADAVRPVSVHPARLAGRTAEQKIADLQGVLKAAGQSAAIVTLPDSIAWLLNIRGEDVPHNPVALAFLILHATGRPELFIDKAKLGAEAREHLDGLVTLRKPADLAARIDALAGAKGPVRLDPETAAYWFARRLARAKVAIARAADPCLLPKAKKNAAEIRGTRAAHLRDGAAVCRFLAWLDREAPAGRVDEIMAAQELERQRRATNKLKDLSFDTISGSGPNGAIVHYKVTEATNRRLGRGELFLLDSGGQFADGTTDITRTIAIGPPTREMQERFTLVLKGHVAVATARFPAGTRGCDIDVLARRPLWSAGLDFDHGTGHGVGSYLSVHEGPQRIAKTGMVPLEPGMIVSNEPGYYKVGAYGIRIENLLLVTEATAVAGGERAMLGFETLSLAPFDRRLVLPELLEAVEIAWLDAYHDRVAEALAPALDGDDRDWLVAATRPLARH